VALPVLFLQATPALSAPAPAETSTSSSDKPLDVREPPFGAYDYAWMNGSNPQPSSLLGMGPVTWSIYVDTYYAWQFAQPQDHTIFPTTTAPRHDEISLNLAHLGVDVTGLDGPIGRLYIQYGSIVQTIAGQDTTTTRGFFLTSSVLEYLEQAAAGWHFHWLHGVNTELGIFPSYIGLESYLPEENWAYTHAFIADATPYYFFGFRGQIFPSDKLKIELWVVNGWQTYGQWHEGRAGGYLWNWRPNGTVSLVNSLYAGQDVEADPNAVRLYSDNNLQLRYFHRDAKILRSMAFSLVGDLGYEQRSNAPSGPMGGVSLTHRWEWTERWRSSLRGDFLYDQTQAISPKFPVGAAYPWKGTDPFFAAGLTATLDFWPSPWLVTRLEFAHRIANQPLFSGPGGITGPNGQLPSASNAGPFTPDLRTTDDRVMFNVTLRL
jgi:Putative beta-barrel porin-2, OmpL-like. bbp2